MPAPSRFLLCLALLPLGLGRSIAAAEKPAAPLTVRLAAGGRALLPVIVPARPSPRIERAGKTLADYLGRISGAVFAVQVGDGKSGIAVGRPGDFPALDLGTSWNASGPSRREDYLLRSHARGLQVIGATDLAVEYAVWDLLHRLGHRQFFPGKTWEVVPRAAILAIAVGAREHPAYLSRDIGFGFGPWGRRRQLYEQWCVRNRLAGGGTDRPLLESGHSYDRILADLKEEFVRHPEYLALVGGKRRPVPGETKFCIANPGLRKLVARYAVDHFTRHRDAASISLDPSDGLSWCECKECRALGSVSDRVITLANEAAAAIRARHGRDRLVSIYAYAAHAPPPRLRVDEQVVVNVATAMTHGEQSTDELIDGWRRQGARLGIREYYGVYPWDRDLPGQPRLADLAYLAESTRRFHRKGARFLCAESSDNWGVAGLGYYLLARMLWDVREADRVEALRADFLEKAFDTARKPMDEFYRLLDAGSRPRLSSDLIGRMYRLLEEAWKKSAGPAVAARIGELVLYARYVEMYRDYASAQGKDRQRAFADLLRYTYRIRDTGMVHSLAVWRGLPYYDRTVRLPAGSGYEVPEGKDPLKQSKPFTRRELADIVSAGIARNRLTDFTPVNYSTKLVPAGALGLPRVPAGSAGLYFRDQATFYTWVEKAPALLPLTVKAGLIYQNVGAARLSLHRGGTIVARSAVPPDQKEYPVRFRPRAAGLHRAQLSDRTGGTILTWPAGTPWTVPAGQEENVALHGRWALYFYVPKGTKVVAGHADGEGELLDGSGKKVFTFAARPDYFSVPVPPGQQGKLWKFAGCLGRRVLLTVPPYLARDDRELLLPEEVVQADRKR